VRRKDVAHPTRLSNLELLRELTGDDPQRCPHCGKGALIEVAVFPIACHTAIMTLRNSRQLHDV
jgi:hypothetical protein